MKKLVPAAVLAVAALTLVPASPAAAAPWDGNDIDFGLGNWEFSSSNFYVDDVYLVFPDTSSEYTDIWDGAAQTSITSAALSLSDEGVGCESDASIDQSIDGATGDLVLTCTVTNPTFVDAGLSIVAEIRVYAGSDLVRASLVITNTSDAPIDIDSVDYYTDFGSTGELFDYENQDDLVLPVPAAESSDFAPILNDADARWIVHWEEDDAPGGIVIGAGASEAPTSWIETSGDTYEYRIGAFTIPAGESRTTATFVNWHPQSLIDGDYANDGTDPDLLDASAAATVASMSEFASLSGRLATGLTAAEVVNWGPADVVVVPEPEPEPELAATGASDTAVLALAALVLLGAGSLVVARRRVRA